MPARTLFLVLVAAVCGCGKETSLPTAPTAGTVPTLSNPTPPAGAMFVKGTVSDTAYRPLAGARVEVLDGPQTGLSATADARGDFSMSGVFDEATRFRAAAQGHITTTRTLQRNGWINFALAPIDPPVDIGGDYTMTFTADNTCTMLPDDMRSRTYTATIPMTSSEIAADAFFRAGGATFFEDWDAIGVGVAGDYVALWFETLVERVSSNTFLAFAGQAAATVEPSNPSSFVLPVRGSIEYCVTTAENGRYQDCYQGRANRRRCDSNHQLTLTRH